MRKMLLAAAVTGAFAGPAFMGVQSAMAQESAHTITGNLGLFSDYRFRGLTQTFEKPALQGGFDYSHASGLYLGNWNSNVSSALYPNGNLEMDFYGGFRGTLAGDFGFDVGALYYYYPGTKATLTNPQTGSTVTDTKIDNTEIYAAVSWKFLTLKYSHAVSDFFGVPDTEDSYYLELNGSYDLGGGWGINGHVGQQEVEDFDDASYTDWKIGVTKDIGGYVFGLAYVDTDAKDAAYLLSDARKTMNIGDATAVVSVSKSF